MTRIYKNLLTQRQACSKKEEEREAKVVLEEETIVGKEQIHTTSSPFSSEEKEHGAGAISAEIKYDTTKEEVPTELDGAVEEGIIGKQTFSTDKLEEWTTSSKLLLNIKEEAMISTVEKIEEEKIEEAEIPKENILEDIFDAKRTRYAWRRKRFRSLKDARKYEIAATQTLTSSSRLPRT